MPMMPESIYDDDMICAIFLRRRAQCLDTHNARDIAAALAAKFDYSIWRMPFSISTFYRL